MSKYVKRVSRNTQGRDLIVGDIHGYFTKLQAALDAVGFNPAAGDRLFSVGDLVDRGPESMMALQWLARPWFHAVAGNHEDMAINWDAGGMPVHNYAANGGSWNIASDKTTRREIALAFAELPIAIELETCGGVVAIVHADCPAPSWPQFVGSLESVLISEMERMHLISMAQWSRHRRDRLMDHGVEGVRAVVVGHTPMERWTSLGNVIYIDTGGWQGRQFCILDADTLRPAQKPSAPQWGSGMTEYALHAVFTDPEQAKAALLRQIGPYCREQWARGVQRLSVVIQPEEDAKSIQQRKYYHGVILKEIAEQARVNGERFDLNAWKEYFREKFVGYRWVVMKDPMTGKRLRRKVRISTEELGISKYSALIEQVTAFAATDLGVRFSVDRWQDYRE
jgi:serine/threonine protein phosphatase 1